MPVVLGINCLAHDTAAALVADGKLVAFLEEERLSRDKHTWAFPDLAIGWCLKEAGITIGEVDLVTFDFRPGLDYARGVAFDILPRFPRSVKHWAKQTYVDGWHLWKAIAFRRRWGYRGRIRFIEHHLAHAAAAYLSSPFDHAAALTIDRGGDYLSTTVYACEGIQLRPLLRVRNPHSLGELYSALTWWLGFMPNWDEGKVMAVASFGRPTYLEDFRRMVRLRPDGGFQIDLSWAGWHVERSWLSAKFLDRFGPRRAPSEPLTAHHEDVAYALQTVTEEAALHLARAAAERLPEVRALCLSGGVALNSVMNARVAVEGPFEDLFIPAPAGDAGNALGGALLAWHQETGKPRDWQMEHAFFGPRYSEAEIRRCLDERKLTYRRVDDPSDEAAGLLAAGKIVGWFQGRAEAGPRALGNRSILADPRPAHMKDTLNAEVKHREPFRPFAPAVLAGSASEWFEHARPSPFMLLVLPIRPERRDQVPAVTHVDGTGRLQTVTEAANPELHRLIEAFERRTGVPMVLNTSFNDRGEPIVCSPQDALRTYFGTGLDALVIGPYVLEKKPSR
jgi:carbamoyltransferase